MTNWLPLALLTALCLAGYNVFIKLAANSLSPAVGAVVLQLVAAGLGAGWLLRLWLAGQPLPVAGRGLGLAALAGLCVGLAEILTFVVFRRGVPASVGTPVIVGGIGAARSLTLGQVGGLALIVGGIGLVARG